MSKGAVLQLLLGLFLRRLQGVQLFLGGTDCILTGFKPSVPLDDWKAFAKATKLKAALLKKVRPYITETAATAKPIEGEADVELRDTEVVPFTYDGGFDAFIENEVHPFAPDAYVDEKKTQIGYEISFTKFFYKPTELRAVKTIISDLESLEMQTIGMLQDILGGLN